MMKKASTRHSINRLLDHCSTLAKQPPPKCKRCGSPMTPVEVQLWLYGTEQAWKVSVPFCLTCDPPQVCHVAGAEGQWIQ